MKNNNFQRVLIPGDRFEKEKRYWLDKFAGEPPVSGFNFHRPGIDHGRGRRETVTRRLAGGLYRELSRMSAGSDYALFIILATGVYYLLNRYSLNDDLVIGMPIFKQENPGTYINNTLALRVRFDNDMTFKDVLARVKEAVVEANENMNYPLAELLKELRPGSGGQDQPLPLFNVLMGLTGIHEETPFEDPRGGIMSGIMSDIMFVFRDTETAIEVRVLYNSPLFDKPFVESLQRYYCRYLEEITQDPGIALARIDILSPEEKQQLLETFNQTQTRGSYDHTIHELFERQVERTPDEPALYVENETLSYDSLNRRANSLARVLRQKGVKPNDIAGIMQPRSARMVVDMLAVLKAGGACFMIDPHTPENRIARILEDCRAPLLLTSKAALGDKSFSHLQGLRTVTAQPRLTPMRPQIRDLDSLPLPDRSLVNYEKYDPYIGDPMVKNTYITLQATRGCPYNCTYCHKIWPKSHICRSAEHIFEEVRFYYEMGVRRFSFLDDVFNLNIKNSSRFFRMIIDAGLDVQFFFPNGLRGDILTKDYIDLMFQAGTTAMALALESGSDRIQKLMKKNLNLEKFRENIEYICRRYPHVILELFTMHGFPTETKEEALMTMDFIKSLKWVHFPYINIVRLYSNSEMERLALANGVTRSQILRSEGLAYHELPDTLPFEKSFTREYQNDFLNSYFLSKERLLTLLPYQAKVLTKDELVQKYNSYLPAEIRRFEDILDFAGIRPEELDIPRFLDEDHMLVKNLHQKITRHFKPVKPAVRAYRVLLLDLSQFFLSEGSVLYDMAEPPLGLITLLTYLNKTFGERICGKVAKSRFDFEDFGELKQLISQFKPDLIGLRTLSYFKEFLHETVAMIRQWGFDMPIITGGPYATSNYTEVLQNRDIKLVVLGEGEVTFTRLLETILDNNGRFPDDRSLETINGIAYIPGDANPVKITSRQILLTGELNRPLEDPPGGEPETVNQPADFAFCVFTSGSTGLPKGVPLRHAGVINHANTKIRELSLHRDNNDIMAQNLNVGFVASIWQFISPLISGIPLHIYPESSITDPYIFFSKVAEDRLTAAEVVPSVLDTYLDLLENGKTPIEFPHLRVLALTGERVSPTLVNRFYSRYKTVLVNAYGQSECSDDTLHYTIPYDLQTRLVPIGTPADNTRVYILDKNHRLQPPDAPGEIYIGGAGLAPGYLNRPELTAESFVSLEVGEVYRTGDLGRRLPGGQVEFLGRADHQVKIRGFRIEPGEIETVLLTHDEIKEAAVTVGGAEGHTFLAAYVVFRKAIDTGSGDFDFIISRLREYLAMGLPAYMVPAYIIPVDGIPLTPSGKIDRKALPDPETAGRHQQDTRPGQMAEIERALAGFMGEVLKIDGANIGPDSNFFELGGNSLKAVTLAARIHKELDADLSLMDIFEAPTPSGLSQFIDDAAPGDFSAVESAEEKEYYPLSAAQKRLYIVQTMDPTGAGYNNPQSVTLQGDIDLSRLEHAFQTLIRRHESLRTSFHMIDDEPVQKVHDTVEFSIGQIGPIGPIGPIVPFELSEAPLFRVVVLKQGEDTYHLVLDMHHIITDGTSMVMMIRELAALYNGMELAPLKLQYRDYCQWYNSPRARESRAQQERFWLDRFSGAIPVLQLPTDFERPGVQRFEGDRLSFSLSAEETRLLKNLVESVNATMYMGLLAVFHIFLSKLSGQADIVTGTPVAGRNHADTQGIIGMFVNTLAMRQFPSGNKTGSGFLAEVREDTLEAFENQDYPFEDLVEHLPITRDISRNPLFDVLFALQNIDMEMIDSQTAARELTVSPGKTEHKSAKFDLALWAREAADTINLSLEFSTSLFRRDTIQRFTNYFNTLLHQFVHHPHTPIAELELTSTREKQQILTQFNDTAAHHPTDKTLHQLFREQAQRTPDRIALRFGKNRSYRSNRSNRSYITYRQFDCYTDQIAHTLRNRGVTPGSIVALKMERSVDMALSIFAILKAGAAYLPIDPGYPQDRIDYILKDSNAALLIDSPLERGGAMEETETAADNPAYVIYTSGSTGKPKGVAVEHVSAVNIIYGMQNLYPLGASDTYLFKTSFLFDVSVTELFGWFPAGGRLAVLEAGGEKDPHTILDTIRDANVTHINFVPSMFRVFLEVLGEENTSRISGLKYIFLAGEALPPRLVEDFKRLDTGIALENIYGPTEGTVYACNYSLSSWNGGPVPIGKPMPNIRLYILDKYRSLQPIGVPGELCIGGTGVARGYLNRPGLTAERFVFTEQHTIHRLYRTGDLASWTPDGNIQFLGRMDFQVKVRGFRIEPGEIENLLVKHSRVKEAIVTLGGGDGDAYLRAYVVPVEPGVSMAILETYLAGLVPDYMVPAQFIPVEEMPLTAAGKINRAALPRPEITGGGAYQAPGNAVEKELVRMWSEVLGIGTGKISVHDNFFRLGGHSLKAILLISRIHKTLDRKLAVPDIFKTPTISGLAAKIAGQDRPGEQFLSISPAEQKEYYPLSSAQKRLYLLDRFGNTGAGYNLFSAFNIRGRIDLLRLSRAAASLISRHESLRTSFETVDNEPVQRIHDHAACKIEEYGDGFIRPFDLACAPLVRVAAVTSADQENLILLDMHHIISDAASLEILAAETAALYNGDAALPPVTVQYKDFTVWQNRLMESGRLEEQGAFWIDNLAQLPAPLNLPLDFQRPRVQSFEGDRVSFTVDAEDARLLKQIAGEKEVTLFMTVLSIFNVFLYKISGDEDIIVGAPTAGRGHADLERTVGMFVNTLPLRNFPWGGQSFDLFLQEVKTNTLKVFENQDYPFEQVVEQLSIPRDSNRNPVFDVVFVFKPGAPPSSQSQNLHPPVSKFDLTLFCTESAESLHFMLEYCTKLFEKETIQRFAGYFKEILSTLAGDTGIFLKDIQLSHQLSVEEKQLILETFNNTSTPYPEDKTIHQVFAEQVARVPHRVAAAEGLHGLTYRELDQRSNRLANRLNNRGAAAGTIIGLDVERSLDMLVGILGILKAGGAYLPLEPSYPEERQKRVLMDSHVSIVLTRSGARRYPWIDHEIDLAEDRNEDSSGTPALTSSRSLAYVMFTSGSTGDPKGVMVEHRSVVRLVKETRFITVREDEAVLPTGALDFDASTLEIWAPLLNGARVCLVTTADILMPEQLKRCIRLHRVTFMWMTSPLFNQVVSMDTGIFRGVRTLLVGGDVLSPPHINRVRVEFPGIQIINGYGPTENTTFSTTFRVNRDFEDSIPIGKPISNSTAYVLDGRQRLQPIGAVGELYVGGHGLARGYMNNPELTHDLFPPHPYKPNERLYRTGDLTRWLEDGNIKFLGRVDQQVKIRGYRIEPGEIQHRLLQCPGVKQAAVIAVTPSAGGDKILCAYIIPEGNTTVDRVREFLVKELPEHMAPAFIQTMEQFPLTPNGKLDRKKLPLPDTRSLPGVFAAPANDTEKTIIHIWSGILDIPAEKISALHNFFELGGHSLAAVKMLTLLHKELNTKIPLEEVFVQPTARDLAACIQESSGQVFISLEPAEEKEYYVLSSPQRRLFTLQQLEPSSVCYNIPRVMVLDGEFRKDRLDSSFSQLLERHEVLRTSFFVHRGEPVQRVLARVAPGVPCYRMDEEEARAFVDDFVQPFDLSAAPLLRAALIRLNRGKQVLAFDMHHIVTDMISMDILEHDFLAFYSGNGGSLPVLSVQYKDFAQWQHAAGQTARLKDQERFWLDRFKDRVPELNLPLDRPRPKVQQFEGENIHFSLDPIHVKALNHLAAESGATMFMVLLAAYNVLLSKICGQHDIVMGTTTAGRSHADLQQVIGIFVNALVLRNQPLPGLSFKDFLTEVRRDTLDAFENQEYPFEDLVEKLVRKRDVSRNPLFDVMFSYKKIQAAAKNNNTAAPGQTPDVTVRRYTPNTRNAHFDLMLLAADGGESVDMALEYSIHLFEPGTIAEIKDYLLEILEQVAGQPGFHQV
jgi:tyrocidine synthetase-3